MNPLTNVKNITKLNELELARGTVDKKSWHDMYKDSAWIFIGGLSYGLTEGDMLSVFSQYGEIVNINLVRDTKTGKIKGYCFLCYSNQKSTILAVDNFNGIKLCGRTIRVDHVSNYKPPKEHENDDELTKQLKHAGCAPVPIKLETADSSNVSEITSEKKKSKKVKKEKKKHKKKRKHESNKDIANYKKIKVKEEKIDPGYTKNELSLKEKDPKRKDRQRDSSDGETSSTESDSCDPDSSSQLLPRKEESRHKHKTKQSDQNYKEKHDNHNNSRIRRDGEAYKKYAIAHKERNLSRSDSDKESVKRKKIQNDDYLNNTSSGSKSYRSSDQVQKRSHPDDDHYNERSDFHKDKYLSEYKKSASRHQRHYSASNSESDVSSQLKARDTENEQHTKSRHKHDRLGKGYSKSPKRYERSPHHREDKGYEKKSRHDRDGRKDKV